MSEKIITLVNSMPEYSEEREVFTDEEQLGLNKYDEEMEEYLHEGNNIGKAATALEVFAAMDVMSPQAVGKLTYRTTYNKNGTTSKDECDIQK